MVYFVAKALQCECPDLLADALAVQDVFGARIAARYVFLQARDAFGTLR
jgi:hypothetical protein